MTARVYSSPPAFKQALEQRLKAASKDGVDFARRRQLLAFDRFLARVSAAFGNSVLLKGGLVLELRLERARTTKDVDLKVTGSPAKLLASLQLAGQQDLGDFMTFEVNPDAEHPIIDNDGMQYEGQRFRAECRLAGKLYGQRFGVDVASSDPVFGEPVQALRRERFGPLPASPRSFTPFLWGQGQSQLLGSGFLPLAAHESHRLLAAPFTLLAQDRSGLHRLRGYYALC